MSVVVGLVVIAAVLCAASGCGTSDEEIAAAVSVALADSQRNTEGDHADLACAALMDELILVEIEYRRLAAQVSQRLPESSSTEQVFPGWEAVRSWRLANEAIDELRDRHNDALRTCSYFPLRRTHDLEGLFDLHRELCDWRKSEFDLDC